MLRFVVAVAMPLTLTVGCADPGCPLGSMEAASGRCLPDPAEPAPSTPDASAPSSPDAEPAGFAIVELPVATQWLTEGETASIELRVSTAPSYYGPLAVEVHGLPEGVAVAADEDFRGAAFELEAAVGLPVGGMHVVTVRAYAEEVPEVTGESSFVLGVRGPRGARDRSFDADGMRSDAPLDGTRDALTDITFDGTGAIVVAGDGSADGARLGFLSRYGRDGVSEGESVRVEVLGARITEVTGVLPMGSGTLVAVRADTFEHVLRYDGEGNVDVSFATDASGERPGVLTGGILEAHGDGFLLSFRTQLERYRADGSLDRDFGTAGVVTPDGVWSPHVATFADESIVRAATTDDSRQVFTRLDARGQPHLAFGSRGVAEIPGYRYIQGLATVDDGAIVYVDNTLVLSAEEVVGALRALTADGMIDGDFGAAGVVTIDDGASVALATRGVVVHGERIYVLGERIRGAGEAPHGYVAAYAFDGTLDVGFGEDGFSDLGELVLPRAGVVDADADRLVIGCDQRLSASREAARMIAVVRIWL